MCIDIGPQHSAQLKVAAVVMFALALFNVFDCMMHYSGAFLPSGPQAELDEFGNPILPTINGIEDIDKLFP